jgi:hypothetical protein
MLGPLRYGSWADRASLMLGPLRYVGPAENYVIFPMPWPVR